MGKPYQSFILAMICLAFTFTAIGGDWTVLNDYKYKQIIKNSRAKIRQLLTELQPYRKQNANQQVAYIVSQLENIPYLAIGAMGEGDWQPGSWVYKPDAIHINQYPVYRLDGLDCQTFAQIVMALLYSKNLTQFDQTLLKIAYGAAGNTPGNIVRYFNRNHFVDGDFNPINQRNGWLTDVTLKGLLSSYTEVITTTLHRNHWFLVQQQNLAETINVLADNNGPAMVERYKTVYSSLPYPHFQSDQVSMTYIPKKKIALRQLDKSYKPNQVLLDAIPTPAIVEIVRHPKKLAFFKIKAKDIIGAESTISHMGLLYRKTFKQGDIIYQKIHCELNKQYQKTCKITPIMCTKEECNELMFAHATDAFPDGYYYYQQTNSQFVCSPIKPNINFTKCNRVVSMPLFDYLTDNQFGFYTYMESPSLLGIHIEKLT